LITLSILIALQDDQGDQLAYLPKVIKAIKAFSDPI